MNMFAVCPCCSDSLIHCYHNHREFWFCRTCWQEMPNLSAKHSHSKNSIVTLPPRLVKHKSVVS